MAEEPSMEKLISRHREFLVERIDPDFGFLNKLFSNGTLTNQEFNEIKIQRSFIQRNSKILDLILDKRCCDSLLTSLKESNQKHIVNYLTSNGVSTSDLEAEWPLTDKEIDILRINHDSLIDLLDPSEFIDHLHSSGVLSKRQRESIKSKSTDYEKNEHFLEILRRCSLASYWQTIRCLHETNQSHVAKVFEAGGVLALLHVSVEADLQNITEAEQRIASQINNLLSDSSLPQTNRILEQVIALKLIAAKHAHSIMLYFLCQQPTDMEKLKQMTNDGSLKDIVETLFNQLFNHFILTPIKIQVKLKWTTNIFTQRYDMIKVSNSNFKMASVDKEAIKRLHSLTQCCICWMTYNDPRMLPCFHTACLVCFENLQSKNIKKPGDVLPCPLCRKEFTIPSEGMKGLQKNFFIETLMEVTKAVKVQDRSLPCSNCSLMEEASEATLRCLNCRESYCLRCSKIHKSQKLTKEHKLVEIKSEYKEEEIRNMLPIRNCKKHSEKALDYYCSDCETVICVSCQAVDHQTHKVNEVEAVHENFRQRLEGSLGKMSDSMKEILRKKMEVERQETEFSDRTLVTEKAIMAKSQLLKTLIDQHTQDVLDELASLKQRHRKKMEEKMEEIETKRTVLESFMTYCTEMKSKGSASAVCDCTDTLISRANELYKENKEYLSSPITPVALEFNETDQNALLKNVSNIIGKISVTAKFLKRLELPALPHPVASTTTVIRGITKLQNRIYILCKEPRYVVVFDDREPFQRLETIPIGGIESPNDIASSNISKCLYFVDTGLKTIWEKKPTDDYPLIRWSVQLRNPDNLSISNDDRLLVLDRSHPANLEIFGLDRKLIQRLSLPVEINRPLHCIEAPNGGFIISDMEPFMIHRVSSDGKAILRRYHTNSASEELTWPWYMSLDCDNDRLFVTDQWNDRVIVLDWKSLQLKNIIITDLMKPFRLLYDSNKKQLIVGQYGERVDVYDVSNTTNDNYL